ncbi:MAG: FG-GAP-like repeat-containing protein, partial [Bacteroidota bacterium]
GTKVSIYYGDKVQTIETTNVRGMYSTSEDVLHFGLGEATQVDLIEVVWPDGLMSRKKKIAANQTFLFPKQEFFMYDLNAPPPPLLEEVTVTLPYQHRENYFDDYRHQVLLPHKQSQNGPAAAVGDVNGDGLDDLYLGGSSGQAGELYLQTEAGSFSPSSAETFRGGSLLEDVAAIFFEADNDGDLDLYVVSGGNEFEAGSPFYQDRLYLNDGQGNFTVGNDRLPAFTSSGGCVSAADFDQDGDLDLFVGGRLQPHDYPAPAASYLLRNDGGTFTDVTDELAPFLRKLGLVTAAEWTDLDNDGQLDIMVVGEWMPLTVLYQRGDHFEPATDFTDASSPTTGWWFGLGKADLDGDGDDDFIFGNLGENYKYQASPAEPFEVFYDDF